MVMSLVFFGHVVPQAEGEEGEREEEKVEKVEERALPVRGEAVMVEREQEKKEGDTPASSVSSNLAGDWTSVSVDNDMFGLLEDLKATWQSFPSFPPPPDPSQQQLPVPHLNFPPGETFVAPPLLLHHVPLAAPPPSTKSSSLSPPPLPSHHFLSKLHYPKPKKKLSKHHVKSSKYAPGDYTEFPDPAPNSASQSSAANPYRSFLISSCVDQRLSRSLDYPSELRLQSIAREQYEAVLRSILTAQPSPHLAEGEKREERGEEKERGEGGLDEACDLVCESLDRLLQLTRGSQPQVELVTLLLFWSELHSLLFQQKKKSPLSGVGGEKKQQRSLSSPKLLRELVECLSHASSGHTSSRDATWQIGFSLLHQLCSSFTSSLPILPSHLSHLLLTFFTSSGELSSVGVARGVVSEFLKTVLELNLDGDGITGDGEEKREIGEDEKRKMEENGGEEVKAEGMKGVHIILDVLVKILEERYIQSFTKCT